MSDILLALDSGDLAMLTLLDLLAAVGPLLPPEASEHLIWYQSFCPRLANKLPH